MTARSSDPMVCERHPNTPWPHDNCPGPGMPAQPSGPSVERAQLLIDCLFDELRGLRDSLPRVANPDVAPQRQLAVGLTALEDVQFRVGAAQILVHEMLKTGEGS